MRVAANFHIRAPAPAYASCYSMHLVPRPCSRPCHSFRVPQGRGCNGSPGGLFGARLRFSAFPFALRAPILKGCSPGFCSLQRRGRSSVKRTASPLRRRRAGSSWGECPAFPRRLVLSNLPSRSGPTGTAGRVSGAVAGLWLLTVPSWGFGRGNAPCGRRSRLGACPPPVLPSIPAGSCLGTARPGRRRSRPAGSP